MIAPRRPGWEALPLRARTAIAVGAASLLTAAGGMLDAWVYVDHGHVFATAQTGNVVLSAIALSNGNVDGAVRHVPSMAAFLAGMLVSQLSAEALKRRRWNSRTVRLVAETAVLLVLAALVHRLSTGAVTASVGFVAGVQITSLSHIGRWRFNTGMTTGNLRGAVTAFSRAMLGRADAGEWSHAAAMGFICAAFAIGALLGAWLAPRWHGATLLVTGTLVLAAALASAGAPDPLTLD